MKTNLLKKIKILFYGKCSHPECGEPASPHIEDYGLCRFHADEVLKIFWSNPDHKQNIVEVLQKIVKK